MINGKITHRLYLRELTKNITRSTTNVRMVYNYVDNSEVTPSFMSDFEKYYCGTCDAWYDWDEVCDHEKEIVGDEYCQDCSLPKDDCICGLFDICDDCGHYQDQCVCTYCPICGQKEIYCSCPKPCSKCGEYGCDGSCDYHCFKCGSHYCDGSCDEGSGGEGDSDVKKDGIVSNAEEMREKLNQDKNFQKRVIDLAKAMRTSTNEQGWLVTSDGIIIKPDSEKEHSLTFEYNTYIGKKIKEFTHGHHLLNYPSFADYRSLETFYEYGVLGDQFTMVLVTPTVCTVLTVNDESKFKMFVDKIQKDDGTLETKYLESFRNKLNEIERFDAMATFYKEQSAGLDISYTPYKKDTENWEWKGLEAYSND